MASLLENTLDHNLTIQLLQTASLLVLNIVKEADKKYLMNARFF